MQLVKRFGFVVMTLGLLVAGDSLSSDEGDEMPRTSTNPPLTNSPATNLPAE